MSLKGQKRLSSRQVVSPRLRTRLHIRRKIGGLLASNCRKARMLHYLRSGLKPARTSSEKSCGCSQAAKCPPLESLL